MVALSRPDPKVVMQKPHFSLEDGTNFESLLMLLWICCCYVVKIAIFLVL